MKGIRQIGRDAFELEVRLNKEDLDDHYMRENELFWRCILTPENFKVWKCLQERKDFSTLLPRDGDLNKCDKVIDQFVEWMNSGCHKRHIEKEQRNDTRGKRKAVFEGV